MERYDIWKTAAPEDDIDDRIEGCDGSFYAICRGCDGKRHSGGLICEECHGTGELEFVSVEQAREYLRSGDDAEPEEEGVPF